MQPVECLRVWEDARTQHPVDRALTLLSLWHEEPRSRMASWSLGARNEALLRGHNHDLGSSLQAGSTCPACEGAVELELPIADLLAHSEPKPQSERSGTLSWGDRTLAFRAPDSLDLAAIAALDEPQQARLILVQRCLLEDETAQPVELDEDLIEALSAAIEALDPKAHIVLELHCAECGHRWTQALDVAEFVWTRVREQAQRLLLQVDRLASAYGWSEGEVLGLSPLRREWYVEALS